MSGPCEAIVAEFQVQTPNSPPNPTTHPLGITAGPDGNLWFAEYVNNRIGHIIP